MNMELDTPDGRKKYLSEKLDNLMEGINDSYGKMLLEELISRLEAEHSGDYNHALTPVVIENVTSVNGCMLEKPLRGVFAKEKDRERISEVLDLIQNSSFENKKEWMKILNNGEQKSL